MQVIALTGKTGVGKDYLAKTVCDKYYIIGFGDLMKEDMIRNYGFDFHELYESKTFESRTAMREYAERIAKKADKYRYVRQMQLRIEIAKTHGYNKFMITDLRFPEEFELIKTLGGHVIKIVNEEGNHVRRHIEQRVNENEMNPLNDFDTEFVNDMADKSSILRFKKLIESIEGLV